MEQNVLDAIEQVREVSKKEMDMKIILRWKQCIKMKLSIKDFFSKCEEIFNEKLHFLCNDIYNKCCKFRCGLA